MNVEGKVVVITGASSGIGESTARLLAGRGAKVAIAARRKDRIDTIAEDITSNGHAIGRVFKDYVAKHKIDLLVMGAYGHSRIREFILGGATKSILQHPPTWVLLSH